ncbi:MAG: response regulator transcription factor [Lewinellaceae bacterium]|nr:response regulator transcription factor [Lewinellaceae bacterium]
MHITIIGADTTFMNLVAQLLRANQHKVTMASPDPKSIASTLHAMKENDMLLLESCDAVFISTIRQKSSHNKIILLVEQPSTDELVEALQSGACSACLKSNWLLELPEAIAQCQEGLSYLSPMLTTQLILFLRQTNDTSSPQQTAIAKWGLVKREAQVLQGLMKEKTYGEIAHDLHISINTVRHYVKCLYKKAAVNKRKHLIAKVLAMLEA